MNPVSETETCYALQCLFVCVQEKDLYQGVMDKLKGLQLQPGWSAVGKTREGYERLRRQVCVALT